MKPLHQLKPGEKAFIVDMRNAKMCERLFEMGIFPGDMIEVKENSSDNQSIVIDVNNTRFNIFKPAAETIITNVVSFQISLN